jgi:hypothetical protein
MRPLTGRELNEQHKALCDAGVSWEFRMDWLRRETDLWVLEREERRDPAVRM